MTEDWAGRYRRLLAEITGRKATNHGYSLRAIEQAETRLGRPLPGPLRDYYLSVGRHKFNQAQHRLLAPDALFVAQGRLVFMEENQSVVYWGVRQRSSAKDPTVFQTVDPDDEVWYAESPCSQFMSGMLCWQAIAGLPHTGYTEPLDSAVARRLTKKWRAVGRIGGSSAFVGMGGVIYTIDEGTSALVYVGASSGRALKELVSAVGVDIHEA